jgi:3D (Asp-Asp-Asp) domain-containing protein
MYITPRRGFFVRKMNKYLKILVVAGLLVYPASIQADVVLVTPSAIASSSVTAIPTVIVTPRITSNSTTSNTKAVYITAYASVPDETSAHPFITASGKTVADGIIAANFLPFGTQIQIPSLFGNKIFTVEDRTSQKFSGRVDIWMPSVAQAIDFGIRKADIVILDTSVALK